MSSEQTAPQPQQIPTGTDRLVMSANFPQFSPAVLFDYWTKPDLICQWWPQQAEIEPREGGAYHFSWPKMGWSLRGHYVKFDIGHSLNFTWRWDHQTTPLRHVEMLFDVLPNGSTQMTLTHGFYTDSAEDQEERTGHIEGWTHFLGTLQQLEPTEER
ncbi:MAG TPA: SRPBCC domain-containing protein [Ktedonobacterales bacterium]